MDPKLLALISEKNSADIEAIAAAVDWPTIIKELPGILKVLPNIGNILATIKAAQEPATT
jgi:hypothetical protein